MARIRIYDTTLRDGSQGEGVNFSLQDKLLITRRLDDVGIDFIEGGYPLSNPKDFEYFKEVQKTPLRHARIAAFGMTRRKGIAAADDTGMKALVDSQAPVITIVGKTWDLHVARCAEHHSRREPEDDRRLRGLLQSGRPRSVLRCGAFLRRSAGQPGVRAANIAGCSGCRRLGRHPVRHKWRHFAGQHRRLVSTRRDGR